jgi:hypothetical protein
MGPVLKPIKDVGNAAAELPLRLFRTAWDRESEIRNWVKKQVADPVASQAYTNLIWHLKENTIL